MKCAVDAIADLEFVLKRFEVNIGCPLVHCLVEDQIDEADHGGGIGGMLKVGQVDGVARIFQIGFQRSEQFIDRIALLAV